MVLARLRRRDLLFSIAVLSLWYLWQLGPIRPLEDYARPPAAIGVVEAGVNTLPVLPDAPRPSGEELSLPRKSDERWIQTPVVPEKRRGACRQGQVVTPRDFGAKGDGIEDDTLKVKSLLLYASDCPGTTVIIGPVGSKFFVNPGELSVELRNAELRFEGHLVGPDLKTWNPNLLKWPAGSCAYGEICGEVTHSPEKARTKWSLLHIRNSSNLTLRGPNGLRAPGWTFWMVRRDRPEVQGYCLLKFEGSEDLRIHGMTLANSPMYHLVIMHCALVDLRGLTVEVQTKRFRGHDKAGKWGPENTDGINIFASQDVRIQDSNISSGDDNVVVKEASRRIRGEGLRLSFGKGINIGSLGENGGDSHIVEDVAFRHVRLYRCRHGVRIKTWKGGRGLLRNAHFEHFQVEEVQLAVLIDQTYCPATQRPRGCSGANGSVSIENVSFKSFAGTFWRDELRATKVLCSRCSGVTFEQINMKKLPGLFSPLRHN